MATQNPTPTSALATSLHTAAQHFGVKVSDFIERQMPGLISSPEANRLTTNLCIKIQAAMDDAISREKEPFGWEDIDTAKFVTDAVKVTMLGLDAAMNECYPIPYRNNKSKKVEIQCSPSAKGLLKLVMQFAAGAKKVVDFKPFVIREGEKFNIKRTPGNDEWTYEEDVFSEAKVRGYVTVLVFDDGTSSVMAHSKADIEKRRAASKAPNSPAWTKWYDEMALAKATRRHVNNIPMQMPKLLAEALTDLDDDDKPMKDVTPPTIAIEAPKAPEIKLPDQEPAAATQVKPAAASAKKSKATSEPTQPPIIDTGFME